MSKVRINDLAREMEVKSRQILDVLAELGLGAGKTHSSSLEEHEAEKVRAQLSGSRAGQSGGARIFARLTGHYAQNRSLAYLQARRRDEGHPGQEAGGGRRGAQSRIARHARRRGRCQAARQAGNAPVAAAAARHCCLRPVRNRARLFRAPPGAAHYRPAPGPRHRQQATRGPVVAKAPATAASARPAVAVVPPPAQSWSSRRSRRQRRKESSTQLRSAPAVAVKPQASAPVASAPSSC